MPSSKCFLWAKPPKPKPKKPRKKKVVVRAGGCGGAGNIRHVKQSATPPSRLVQVKLNNATATTAPLRANVIPHSNLIGSSAKSLSTPPEQHTTHADDGDNIRLPTGREVGLPRNKTTTSGRGGVGNFHDHVLEKGVFRRVIAYEDTVIQPYREMQARKIARTTGRGGAGNVGRPTNNHSSSSKGSNHGSGSFSTRSSETKSRKLTRVKTQTFTHTQMEIESEMVAGMPVPNGTQESASRPKELGVQEMWDLWWPSFRPIPKSRADATAKAHVHLRMAGLTPYVPEVPHSASTSSRPRIGAPSRAPTSSNRVVETQVRILASSHVERAIPRVPKFAPGSTEQSGLTPLSNRFQSQASSKPAARYLPEFYSPTPSNRSTGPPRQTREKKQRHHNGYMAIYSPISSFDHHESGSKQKLPPSRVLNRPHQVGSVHYPGRQTNPLPHADQLPIPGSIGDSSSSTSPHVPTRTNKRRVPLTSREKPLDMTHRGSPDVPEDARPPSPCFAPVPRRIPQRRRRVTVIH